MAEAGEREQQAEPAAPAPTGAAPALTGGVSDSALAGAGQSRPPLNRGTVDAPAGQRGQRRRQRVDERPPRGLRGSHRDLAGARRRRPDARDGRPRSGGHRGPPDRRRVARDGRRAPTSDGRGGAGVRRATGRRRRWRSGTDATGRRRRRGAPVRGDAGRRRAGRRMRPRMPEAEQAPRRWRAAASPCAGRMATGRGDAVGDAAARRGEGRDGRRGAARRGAGPSAGARSRLTAARGTPVQARGRDGAAAGAAAALGVGAAGAGSRAVSVRGAAHGAGAAAGRRP